VAAFGNSRATWVPYSDVAGVFDKQAALLDTGPEKRPLVKKELDLVKQLSARFYRGQKIQSSSFSTYQLSTLYIIKLAHWLYP
jgi:hypothetical protein